MRTKYLKFIYVTTAILFFAEVIVAQIVEREKLSKFLVGTYTDSGSEGIYRYNINLSNGKLSSEGLVAKTENPSFLAITNDKKYVIAALEADNSEHKQGYIELFAVNQDGSLTSKNRVESGGAHPCYVAVNKQNMVLTANYSGGNVSITKIDKTGALSNITDLKQHEGKGANPDRQEKPHAHCAIFEPNGSCVFVADLGIDKVKVYTFDSASVKLLPNKYPEINLTAGSGPRHLVFHPKLKILYVTNELNSTVSIIKIENDGSFKILGSTSTLPKNYNGVNYPADIHFSPDGNFLYVSNRGYNSIAIFAVNKQSGLLQLIENEPTLGDFPRNFAITPNGRFLLVANQKTDNIVSFSRNQKSGKLTFIDKIAAKKPVCLVF